jgi:hypothetical protein
MRTPGTTRTCNLWIRRLAPDLPPLTMVPRCCCSVRDPSVHVHHRFPFLTPVPRASWRHNGNTQRDLRHGNMSRMKLLVVTIVAPCYSVRAVPIDPCPLPTYQAADATQLACAHASPVIVSWDDGFDYSGSVHDPDTWRAEDSQAAYDQGMRTIPLLAEAQREASFTVRKEYDKW